MDNIPHNRRPFDNDRQRPGRTSAIDRDKDPDIYSNRFQLSTIMSDTIPPSQAHLAPPKKSRIVHQPSPTTQMSVGRKEEQGPLRLRGGCIPLPCDGWSCCIIPCCF